MPLMDTRDPRNLQPKEFFGFPVFADGDHAYESQNDSDNDSGGEEDFLNAPPRQGRDESQSSFVADPNDSLTDTTDDSFNRPKSGKTIAIIEMLL